jgi:16S rRNA (cytosine967-C5)-methyltransferase
MNTHSNDFNKNQFKIHRPILAAIEATLYNVFVEGGYARKNIDHQLKNQRKWGARDRRQYAEVCYDLVRWWRFLLCLADLETAGKSTNSETRIAGIMTVPAVDSAVIEKVISVYLKWRENPDLFNVQIQKLNRAQRESIPDWMDEWGISELKSEWPKVMASLNQKAKQFLRVNTLKSNVKILIQDLKNENILTEVVAGANEALVLVDRKNVFQTKSFLRGAFEMQDVGSQMITQFVQPQSGERIVDACAGAGGKTLHLAALMKNSGKIIALDTDERKLGELRKRASRAGATSIETRFIENSKVIKRLYDTADRLLLDVPCSGLGVLKRNPDYKWKLSLNILAEIRETQKEILEKYSPIVKPGGYLIYSTCSIAASENSEQIAAFLVRHAGEFELEAELKVSPADTEFDGFYAARLKRK